MNCVNCLCARGTINLRLSIVCKRRLEVFYSDVRTPHLYCTRQVVLDGAQWDPPYHDLLAAYHLPSCSV